MSLAKAEGNFEGSQTSESNRMNWSHTQSYLFYTTYGKLFPTYSCMLLPHSLFQQIFIWMLIVYQTIYSVVGMCFKQNRHTVLCGTSSLMEELMILSFSFHVWEAVAEAASQGCSSSLCSRSQLLWGIFEISGLVSVSHLTSSVAPALPMIW